MFGKNKMFQTNSESYYDILDIAPDASPNEIRQAYLRAKAAYGKNSAALYTLFDDDDTKAVLEQVEQAYLVLSNPEKRREYDRVHGFLKGPILATQGTPTKPEPVTPQTGPDAAEHAAQEMFGGHSMFEESRETERPRTESPIRFESRIGSIRRTDLLRDYPKDPAMEETILRETSFRGEFLRKIRLYKKISLEELSEFTKISRTYINCIESEDFKGLPAAAYIRGFVVQIAKALKLPTDKVATHYMAYYKSVMQK